MVSRQSVELAIGLAVLAIIALGAFLVLQPFLPSIICAAVLSYATWPLFARLKDALGGREAAAAAIMIVAATLVLVAPVAILAWSMTDQVAVLAGKVRGWVEHGVPELPQWLTAIPLIGGRLRERWHEFLQTGDLAQNLTAYIGGARTHLVAFAGTVGNTLLQMLLSLVIAFFLYCKGPEISAVVDSLGVRLSGERGHRLITVVATTVRSVVESLLGTNLLQAIFGALGFWAAGIPAPLVLGFFLFFLTVIPFGAALVWIPAVIWVASSGRTGTAILLTGWCILVFPVLENVARVFFFKRGSQLPALLVLLGMLGGVSVFGFLGVFIGPALLALVYMLVDEWCAPLAKPV
jgi:predicted PurR-regulated permease PerM